MELSISGSAYGVSSGSDRINAGPSAPLIANAESSAKETIDFRVVLKESLTADSYLTIAAFESPATARAIIRSNADIQSSLNMDLSSIAKAESSASERMNFGPTFNMFPGAESSARESIDFRINLLEKISSVSTGTIGQFTTTISASLGVSSSGFGSIYSSSTVLPEVSGVARSSASERMNFGPTFNMFPGAESSARESIDFRINLRAWAGGSSTGNTQIRSIVPGELDTSFGIGTNVGGFVLSNAVQPNGKIVIAGNFTTVNGIARGYVARLNADGSLDTSFGNGLSGANNSVSSVALQSDGKVLIGGYFTSVNGVARARVARLNSDGSLDTSFGNGLSGADWTVRSVVSQTDGKILVGGDFGSINDSTYVGIARLNSDGSTDTTFNNGIINVYPGAYPVYSIAVQTDGKILIGGDFTSVSGVSRGRIARLNADGTVDTAFGSGLSGAESYVRLVKVQSDGKIVIGGSFTTVNGVARNGIARLNSDGSLDTSFGNGLAGVDNSGVFSALIQSDDKILIVGAFTTVNGTTRGRIARLNSDGSLDTTFGDGLSGVTNANEYVYSVAALPNGKIFIGGGFTRVNGVSKNYIASLLGSYGGAFNFDISGGGTSRSSASEFLSFTREIVSGINAKSNANFAIGPTSLSFIANGESQLRESIDFRTNFAERLTARSFGSLDIPGISLTVSLTAKTGGTISSELDSFINPEIFVSLNAESNGSIRPLWSSVVSSSQGFAGSSSRESIDFRTNFLERAEAVSSGGLALSSEPSKITGSVSVTTSGTVLTSSEMPTFAVGTAKASASERINFGPTFLLLPGSTSSAREIIDFRTNLRASATAESEGWLTQDLTPATSLPVLRLSGTSSASTSLAISVDLVLNAHTKTSGSARTSISGILVIGDANSAARESISFQTNLLERLTAKSSASIDSSSQTIRSLSATLSTKSGATEAISATYEQIRNAIAESSSSNRIGLIIPLNNGVLLNGSGSSTTTNLRTVSSTTLEPLRAFGSSGGRAGLRTSVGGDLDTTFAVGTQVDSFIWSTSIQPDNKIILSGFFTSVNGVARGYVARLNADGTLDTGFGGSNGADWIVFSTAVQSDGKVLIGGLFSNVNSVARGRIARLNSDGSLDTGFGNGLTGVDSGIVYAVSVQSNGKVLVGGFFTTVNGVARNGIARLNSDGSLDTSFGNGLAGVDGGIYSIAVQSDGKIVIGGSFTTVNGVARGKIARLNSDGSLDTTFGNGLAGADSEGLVQSISIQTDNKIIIGGSFTTVNNTQRGGIARLNSNGTLDSGFGSGLSGVAGNVYSTSVRSDGKIIIGGSFSTVSNISRSSIALLNSDGTLDTTFGNNLSGVAGTVYSVAALSDSNVLIAGAFYSVNGVSKNHIAKLYGPSSGGFNFNIAGLGTSRSSASEFLSFTREIVSGINAKSNANFAIGRPISLSVFGSAETNGNITLLGPPVTFRVAGLGSGVSNAGITTQLGAYGSIFIGWGVPL